LWKAILSKEIVSHLREMMEVLLTTIMQPLLPKEIF